MPCVGRRIPCKEAYTEKTNFPMLKFSLAVRPRGHKQRELNDHVYSFLLFVPLALTIKLNFEISQSFSRISRVSQSRFLSGYVRLAVSIFVRSSTFCKVKGFEVPIRLFVLINDVFSSLDIEFH